MGNTITTYELADLLVGWIKRYDPYEYADAGVSDEEAMEETMHELESGNTEGYYLYLSNALDEEEVIEERHEILNLMDMIREYECENGITH